MNVVVNGLMANYQKVGKGKTLVLLPGWGGTIATFPKLTEKLQGNYEILALDLPGFGGTQAPPAAWGISDYSKFVNDWLVKLGVTPFTVLGHSFGGAVAMELASQNHFKKIILLSSAGRRNRQPIRKGALRTISKVGKVPLYLLPPAKRRQLKRKFYKSIGSDAMLLPHMEETYRRIINEDMRPAAAKIIQPTLLIYGAQDKETPPEDGKILHGIIKGSELHILDGGHFLQQQEPQQLAELIINFLQVGAKDV
ncbi:MAG: alpha/beta fold hydrolase [Candidatus Saccharimonadales bacterium]